LPIVKAEVMDNTCIDEQRIVIVWGEAGDGRISSIQIDGGGPITQNQQGNPQTGKPEVTFEDQRSKVIIKKSRDKTKPCADDQKGKDAIIKMIGVTGKFSDVSENFQDKTITMKSEVDITKPNANGDDFKFTLTGEAEARATAFTLSDPQVGNKQGLQLVTDREDSVTGSIGDKRAYQEVIDRGTSRNPFLNAWIRVTVKPAVPRNPQTINNELKQMQDRIRFTLDQTDTSHDDADFNRRSDRNVLERVELTWNCPANSGGSCNKNAAGADNRVGQPNFGSTFYNPTNGHLFVEVRLVGLPLNNSDFGRKNVQILCDAKEVATTHFEIYFPRSGQANGQGNHPPVPDGERANLTNDERTILDRSANWFFYWSQNRRGTGQGVCTYSYTARSGTNPRTLWLTRHPTVRTALGAAVLRGDNLGNIGPMQVDTVWLFNPLCVARPDGFDAGDEAFNNGQPMTRSDQNAQIQATWEAEHTPDLTNIVFDHEVTHVLALNQARQAPAQQDPDGDRVVTAWETPMSMLPNNATSYRQFGGSADNESRDQEFYAWINACFGNTFMGSIEQRTNPNAPFVAIPQGGYNGQVPSTKGNAKEDWSKDGVNWRN